MSNVKLSVVQEKGQVTIPLEIREKMGLKKGDRVSFVETDQGVVIKPAEVIVSDALAEIGQALKAQGLTLEEMIERGREIRGDITGKQLDVAAPRRK